MTTIKWKEKILKERADRLKTPLEKAKNNGEFIVGLEFLLAEERYIIDAVYVSEVVFIKEMTPLPCTPEFVLGIINLRGKILAVIDIKKIMGLPSIGITNLNRVVVVKYNDIELGILADEIVGNSEVYLEKLQRGIVGMSKIQENLILGVSLEGQIVLDIKKLLATSEIIVNEEVV